jgi:hypothetical protein
LINNYFIVIAVAANKSDLYEYNDLVPEEDGKAFAKEIGAIFIETSAKSSSGIDVKIILKYF